MNVKNEMALEFPAISENEAFGRVVVAAFMTQLDPTMEEVSDVKMAVSEAITNVIVHGYEGKEGVVKIIAKIIEDYVQIEIIDKGKGIEDIALARQPLYTTSADTERSGMGFTVMETFMDSVDVLSFIGEGTKVIMAKKISRE